MGEPGVLVRVEGLKKYYPLGGGIFGGARRMVKAVDGVSFSIRRSETLGLVGESGCGKTTTARTILQLQRPTAGRVFLDDVELTQLDPERLRQLRTRMQIVFQDPYASLNPRHTVETIVAEPLVIHGMLRGAALHERVAELLKLVGLEPTHGHRYPHEFSGGQRQRIMIARALSVKPDFLVCDEPISALDVSIQAQVVNLLVDLQSELGLAMLFISHDLRVVRQVSRRVAVIYLGRIVEEGDADDLFATPLHPYTRALVSAAPTPGRAIRDRIVLKGDPPNPADRPAGCAFHPRCPLSVARCRTESPVLLAAAPGRRVACHLVHPQAEPAEAA
jgi:oligopeptide/dipeptide ABC transporter ATP-binding protein